MTRSNGMTSSKKLSFHFILYHTCYICLYFTRGDSAPWRKASKAMSYPVTFNCAKVVFVTWFHHGDCKKKEQIIIIIIINSGDLRGKGRREGGGHVLKA